jgi:hypothetical protein
MAARLDDAPEIISMARTLKLDPRMGSVQEILSYCRNRVQSWAKGAPEVCSIDDLEKLVCRKLNLVIEHVWSDADLDAIIKKYVKLGEAAFSSLKFQLDDDTFATSMERYNVKAGAHDRYVAVIDCRGDKAARRFFTRWHEIAHLLTLVGQLELPFHRSTTEQNPIERLMDAIAGEVGFFGPIFEPALHAELSDTGCLTFSGVERVRAAIQSDASYAATLIACFKRSPQPMVCLEVGPGYKKGEKLQMRSRQMSFFPVAAPVIRLRALKSTSNSVAKEVSFLIHQNMQIPAESLVAKHFADTEGQDSSNELSGREDLLIWKHSDGTTLGEGPLRVHARRIAGVLTALIQRMDSNA